jgi:uncharacterized protein YtpQ (UPF0354 family)
MFGLFGKKKAQAGAPRTADPRQEALDRIIPVVKAVEHESSDAIPIDLPAEHSPISRPLAADLIVLYAEDFPDRFEFISKHRMEQLELTPDELHRLALRNLPNRLPEIQLHGDSPCHMITCGGNFEATLLLHDGLWDAMGENLPGQPMAVVPARDLLFVTGSGWEGAHQFLSELANKELEDKRYALSKQVFTRKAGTWVAVGLAS